MKSDEISAVLGAALQSLPKDTLLRLRSWHALERDLEVAGCLGVAIKGALQPARPQTAAAPTARAAMYDSRH